MPCCCPHAQSASRVFSLFAHRYRKRFERRGFEPSQRQLLEGLAQAGYQGAHVLEIGSGVGHLHQTLLERGAGRATGIDLAPRMIEEAEQWARERGLADRTRYVVGDFMQETLGAADVTVLDKVVCCYPDAHGMVHRALAGTRRVIALTYPRDRWYVRAGIALGALGMKLLRSDFRPYAHSPAAIEGWIRAAGFSKRYQATTFIWLTQVYEREAVAVA
ncbi:methyltransferase domain-containing protein [Ectothiorhodospiraceae bacterium 2226]|nr:methyltransferase domain-containing protein [Ectothiorhodospiraceae bacterium 2226]